MKVIIAGSRDGISYDDVLKAMDECSWTNEITEIVSGKARGADTFGEQWAEENNIPIREFPADWKKFGKTAGPIRNEQMGDYADALVAVWDGKSKGTKHMLDYAKNKKLKFFVYIVEKGNRLIDIFG